MAPTDPSPPAGVPPVLSAHFQAREPSAIRVAQQRFAQRTDGCVAVNAAIGNVQLPMHPAMQARLRALGTPEGPFADGVVAYTPTAGVAEANAAVLRIIEASGADPRGLYSQITEGGSQAMELTVLGACGPAGQDQHPLLMLDPAYTNYVAMAARTGRQVVSVARTLDDAGHFSLPSLAAIEARILATRPGALVVVPYDNPTGQLIDHATLVALASLCVKHGLWFISDEAYRELAYGDGRASSIWRVTDAEVPGIEGRRISIESVSKVFNGCGLRIGALVTDSAAFHEKAVAEQTANLCASALGQALLGALAHEPIEGLRAWAAGLRAHYRAQFVDLADALRAAVPGLVVSSPDAAIYTVVDVRALVGPAFEAADFVRWCAETGRVELPDGPHTLLVAPMAEFYTLPAGAPNPGRTQMRIACVAPPEQMAKVPTLLAALLRAYRDLPPSA